MITSLILALGLSTSPTEVSPINITPSTPSLEARTFRNSRINNELEARTFRNSRINNELEARTFRNSRI